MAVTADSFNIDYSSLTGSHTVKDFFVLAGKSWKDTERDLGGYVI